ncbi:MAG: hypothetical protein KDN05_01205 [Verrucomicrobiae bacterium]|nr:hypothetical protein [Verrucomicrobiae bacterium]
MKPLPSPKSAEVRAAAEKMPSLPTALPAPTGSYSKANRRVGASPGQRAYPWLLLASTATAAAFCLMYITKPVIVAGGGDPQAPESSAGDVSPAPAKESRTLLPSNEGLPGETDPALAALQPPVTSSFEETNLRVQHILSADAPGGHSSRIDLEVPVLYQSRQLRWTTAEVAEARDLLVRLSDYQEKSRELRSEGVALLDSWNSLLDRSLPTDGLRADSPSLPSNQSDAAPASAAGVTSADSIQYEPTGQ